MAFEVDYIPVGDGTKSGDAIVMRFGNLNGSREEQTVVVIDGGFKESGVKIVQHLRNHYNTDEVDLVVLTHPDADHASGLSVVLDQCTVSYLLMHKPWNHAESIRNLFKDGRITASGLKEKLEKSLQHASDLEALAMRKGIKIFEPFEGTTAFENTMHILGPSQEYYELLLTQFRPTPKPIDVLSFLAPVKRMTESIVNLIEDTFDIDLLDNDEETTSAENSTSTVILFEIDGKKLLFTGDAGKTALLRATDYANGQGISLTDLNFLDVPHHGSKRNISSKVLSGIRSRIAFISAARNSEKHPAKKVTNALQKQTTRVFVNRERPLRHSHGAPARSGWSAAQEEIFHDRVEE